ncbi:MAG: DUF115 domain-containing protein [Chlamydiae bacterium]|nr:DUF115 domain-containing protein [Chlamydiota bacterium]
MEEKYAKELLQERFPEISFFLSFSPFTTTLSKRKERIKAGDLENVGLLYVFGIEVSESFPIFSKWLEEKKERILVFIDDDLASYDLFLRGKYTKQILSHLQIHLRYIKPKEKIEEVCEELSYAFIAEKIEVLASDRYAKRKEFQKIKEWILRASSLSFALSQEILYGDQIGKNVLSNFSHLSRSFFTNRLKGKFKDIPMVICGAGPSLENSIEELRLVENRAIILAAGSALPILTHHQILPHLAMAVDPNLEEYEKLKETSACEIPILYAGRLCPLLFSALKGPFGYMQTQTGGLIEEWLEKKLGIKSAPIGTNLSKESFSVTTLAIAFSVFVQCNPIILCGVDLAYTSLKRYSSGMSEKHGKVDLKNLMEDKRATDYLIFRNGVPTITKWIMESDAISDFAKKNAKYSFFNATEGGIGFSGIPNHSLEKIVSSHLMKEYDLREKIRSAIQNCYAFPKTTDQKFSRAKKEMQKSLKKVETIVQNYLLQLEKNRESPMLLLLEMELKEEIAYEGLLRGVVEIAYVRFHNEILAWSHLQKMVESYLDLFKE